VTINYLFPPLNDSVFLSFFPAFRFSCLFTKNEYFASIHLRQKTVDTPATSSLHQNFSHETQDFNIQEICNHFSRKILPHAFS
jgi:hypothetical protein